LVLKGGKTPDRNGFDNRWEPLDNYQAPYREPVLPPPDFDPDSIEARVDIPEVKVIVTTPIPLTQSFNFGGLRQITQEKISTEYNPTPGIEKNPPYVNPEVALKSFKDEVNKGNTDSYNNFFLSDVKKFIADMENFHSARQNPRNAFSYKQNQVEEVTVANPNKFVSQYEFTPTPRTTFLPQLTHTQGITQPKELPTTSRPKLATSPLTQKSIVIPPRSKKFQQPDKSNNYVSLQRFPKSFTATIRPAVARYLI